MLWSSVKVSATTGRLPVKSLPRNLDSSGAAGPAAQPGAWEVAGVLNLEMNPEEALSSPQPLHISLILMFQDLTVPAVVQAATSPPDTV